jgi:uncharacterized protein
VRAVEQAVDWVVAREPDLVAVTGDLLSRPRGRDRLFALLERLGHPYLVLGNHDLADSRDPFSARVELDSVPYGTLLSGSSVELVLRGRRIELHGVDPRDWAAKARRPLELGTSSADLRILLCHFPRVLDLLPPDRFQLILSGHVHAGQIVVPYGFGRLHLAHLRPPYSHGVYRRGAIVMHVSPGLGTTFVPFRLFARPEATELTLRV